ncbi:MAG: AMP-binding protein, partial [Ignavibacteriales bacterium]|nr:AMP-binding protein [Ignavibacteriales bacterium]
MQQRTIPFLFEHSVKKFADNIMMWEKIDTQYKGTTYGEAQKQVHIFAAGLQAVGLQKGDRVALISEGRNDWAVAELGIFYSGAIDVPISVKLDESADLKFRLTHAECKMAIV